MSHREPILRGPLREAAAEDAGKPAELPGLIRSVLLVDGPRNGVMLDLAGDATFESIPNGYEPTEMRASAHALFPDRYRPGTRAERYRVALVREVWRYVL